MAGFITRLRAAMLTTIREHFPTDVVRDVRTHDGDFDAQAIKAYSVNAPAIILSMNGATTQPLARAGGALDAMRVDAFIITKGRTDAQRTDAALLIRERLLPLIFANDWMDAEEPEDPPLPEVVVKAPTQISSVNLFGDDIDQMGLALWLVRWEQMLCLPPLDSDDTLDVFRTYYAEIMNPGTTEPAIAAQQIELEQDE